MFIHSHTLFLLLLSFSSLLPWVCFCSLLSFLHSFFLGLPCLPPQRLFFGAYHFPQGLIKFVCKFSLWCILSLIFQQSHLNVMRETWKERIDAWQKPEKPRKATWGGGGVGTGVLSCVSFTSSPLTMAFSHKYGSPLWFISVIVPGFFWPKPGNSL